MPAATVSAGNSSRMLARTASSTSVSAEKSKSDSIRLTSRGRNSTSSAWIRSPTSDSWRSPSNVRNAAASPAAIACAIRSTSSLRGAPSSSRSATGGEEPAIFSSSIPWPEVIRAVHWASTLRVLSWQSRARSPTAQMADGLQRYRLQPVRSSREWAAYHAIRRDPIFASLLPNQVYDEHDPDEFAPGHFPHLLLRDGEVLGTVRIDLIGKSAAALRLIGIRPDVQRQGYGRACSNFRKKPREPAARPRSSSTRTQARSTSTLPMGTAGANGPTEARSHRASYGWENGCRDKTSRKSGGAGRRFRHRVETVTDAVNRSPETPLRGH